MGLIGNAARFIVSLQAPLRTPAGQMAMMLRGQLRLGQVVKYAVANSSPASLKESARLYIISWPVLHPAAIEKIAGYLWSVESSKLSSARPKLVYFERVNARRMLSLIGEQSPKLMPRINELLSKAPATTSD